MDIPVYPYDFKDCRRDKRLTNEELNKRINKEVERIIEYMKKDGVNNYSISFEDVLIIVDKLSEYGHEYFEISIAEKHHKATIDIKG